MTTKHLLATSIAAALILGSFATARAEDAPDFAADVWPVLEAKCVVCHGPGDAFNKLRFDSAEAILKGGKNGKVLVPGDPAASPMFARTVLDPDDLDIMPAEGDPLTPEEAEILRSWIAAGADFGGWESAF